MDAAYDHIQESLISSPASTDNPTSNPQASLNTEFKEVYKSFSASPWGARIGGFFGTVRKQGESYYETAAQEASTAGGEALKGFTDLRSTLVNRARSLSNTNSNDTTKSPTDQPSENAPNEVNTPREGPTEAQPDKPKARTESEALRESESLISRFRTEASRRLKDIEKAEDAADEALLKFGTNIRNFLRDAVSIAPPPDDESEGAAQNVMFESRDGEGRRVIHSTRLEAQLHAIHTREESFTKDPGSGEWEKWKEDFDVGAKTGEVEKDLERYEELRRMMERLVPEKVEYVAFWMRYYFLRMVVESEEERRRELLKGASSLPETPSWDSDSDAETSATPISKPKSSFTAADITPRIGPASMASSTTIQPTPAQPSHSQPPPSSDPHTLKPAEPRRSQDQHSQPDSDASYDLVSGATSRATGSPKLNEKLRVEEGESEEEDWE